MSNVNHGQGIGFKLGDTVIDKRMLKVFAVKIGALVTTIMPVVIAFTVSFGEKKAEENVAQCDLNPTQAEILTRTMQTLKATSEFRDTDCNFNSECSTCRPPHILCSFATLSPNLWP